MRLQKFLLSSLFFIASLSVYSKDDAETKPLKITPPIVGEVQNYDITWSFLPVGTAVLSISEEILNEQEAYLMRMTTSTNAFADAIYKVRTRIDTWVDKEVNHSLLFDKDQDEGGKHKVARADFDWEKKQVTYSDKNGSKKPISVPDQIFDPLSVVLAVRGLELKVGSSVNIPVSNGKKKVLTKITVLKREKISVPAGTFQALKLEPETGDIGGVFRKSKNASMYVWVSDDPSHRLLKMKSKVIVGSFNAELSSLEGPMAEEFLDNSLESSKKKKYKRRI